MAFAPNIMTREHMRLPGPVKRIARAKRPIGVMFHCTDGRDPKDERDAINAWHATYNWHVNGKGWRDIAYHYAVNRLGMVMQGRALDRVAGAAKGHNVTWKHVVVQGKGDRADGLLRETIEWVVDDLVKLYGPGLLVAGHRDVSSKPCPGDAVYALLQDMYPDRMLVAQ